MRSPSKTQLKLLAFCVALGVNGVQSDDGASAFDELAAAAGLDMREWWTATASGYFNALPKAVILAAVKEATSSESRSRSNYSRRRISPSPPKRRSSGQGGSRHYCAPTQPSGASVGAEQSLCVH